MLPAVSAAASWVESLKMPMREVRKKYTHSDLVLLSWDSRQKSYNMSKNFPSRKSLASPSANVNGVKEDAESYHLPDNVNNGVPINKKWFNEDGDLDLRRATGEQACNYMRSLGVKLVPVMNI